MVYRFFSYSYKGLQLNKSLFFNKGLFFLNGRVLYKKSAFVKGNPFNNSGLVGDTCGSGGSGDSNVLIDSSNLINSVNMSTLNNNNNSSSDNSSSSSSSSSNVNKPINVISNNSSNLVDGVNKSNVNIINKVVNDVNYEESGKKQGIEKLSLKSYLRSLKSNKLNRNTIGFLYNSISSNIVNLSNESTIQDFDKVIKSIDMKSKGFVNKTDISLIPLVGDLYDLLNIKELLAEKSKKAAKEGDLSELYNSESKNDLIIQCLYNFVSVVILQRLVNQIVHLNSIDPKGEDLINFQVLLQEYLRKVDPRIRKYLKGSRINIIDKIYAGYDTEYETKTYGKVELLSVQLSYTGTIVIRINNIDKEDKGLDFGEMLLADGTRIKDSSYSKLLSVPSIEIVVLMVKEMLKALRSYMENSENNEFILGLGKLHQRGLIDKTIDSNNVLEYTIPLTVDKENNPEYVNYFNFHEMGKVNPSFKDIIDLITIKSEEIVDERYNYFNELLKTVGNGELTIDSFDTLNPSNGLDLNSFKGLKVNLIDKEVLVDEEVEKEEGEVNEEGIVLVNENSSNDGNQNYITVSSDMDINPFNKDNNHPNTLMESIGLTGNLRGDHRRTKIIVLGCHFSIADLSILSDFEFIKTKFDNVQETLTTVTKPFVMDKGIKVFLRDTSLLAPAGQGLKDLGVLYDLPKLDIGDYISRMKDLRNENESLFKDYAMRDSEITLRHLLEMEKACFKITGENLIPATLSGLARKFVFKFWKDNDLNLTGFISFGKFSITDFRSLYTPKGIQTTGSVGLYLPMFIAGFRGGRNESFSYGIDRLNIWYDYDLTSAYTTAMSFLGIPNFHKTLHVTSQKQFQSFFKRSNSDSDNNVANSLTINNCYSMFNVKFKFPEDVIYPSLPVSLNDTNTVYLTEGESIATGYEILLALSQGCVITLKEGIIIPFKEDVKPYKDVIEFLQSERRKHKPGSLYNLLYKQLGNSIYGQTAQGFNVLKKLNTRTGELKSSSTSSLSNPLIASHISGLIRAVLGEIMRQVENLEGKIVSCTTDGFITNIKDLNGLLDYDSKLLKIYADLREILSGSREILELKASTKGIISWSTRGQHALDPSSKISAMTGFQPRNYSKEERIKFLVDGFNKEDYEINFGQKTLRKVNEIYKDGGHVTQKVTDKIFRFTYDNRRQIIETDKIPAEALLFTKPLKDLETAKTLDLISNLGNDLYAPNSNYTNKGGSNDYRDTMIRCFIKALTQEKCNLQNTFISYSDIISYIKTTFGITVNANYVAVQKRRKFVANFVPRNNQTMEMVEKVKIKFPEFDDKLFLSK